MEPGRRRGQEITVAGPNGFLRRYRRGGETIVRVAARADAAAEALVVTLVNSGVRRRACASDAAYGEAARAIALGAGATRAGGMERRGERALVRYRRRGAARREHAALRAMSRPGRPSITDPAAIAPVLML